MFYPQELKSVVFITSLLAFKMEIFHIQTCR